MTETAEITGTTETFYTSPLFHILGENPSLVFILSQKNVHRLRRPRQCLIILKKTRRHLQS